jgi:hypothetical protein
MRQVLSQLPYDPAIVYCGRCFVLEGTTEASRLFDMDPKRDVSLIPLKVQWGGADLT